MPNLVVAIPVRDEAALIGDCLRALALQQGSCRADILLLVNNSRDATAEIARGLQPTLPCTVHVVEHNFPAHQATAGHARRLAMHQAAMLVQPGGVVLTTDADGCVAPDWLELNVAALARGADAVCGRAVIDPVDALAIPARLHEDDAREVEYGRLLDQIGCLLDPDPADPWPRHTEDSGASIAVRRDAFLAAGGVPAVASGEDRALVQALRRVDSRIRHEPDVTVVVSGRVVGRAVDGMADTIRRRMIRQDPMLDSAMEPVADRVRRLGARRMVREAWARCEVRETFLLHGARRLGLSAPQLRGWLSLPHFGAVWERVESSSPLLRQSHVARADLAAQTAAAAAVLSSLAAARLQNEPME